jgi:hypothetical protein
LIKINAGLKRHGNSCRLKRTAASRRHAELFHRARRQRSDAELRQVAQQDEVLRIAANIAKLPERLKIFVIAILNSSHSERPTRLFRRPR